MLLKKLCDLQLWTEYLPYSDIYFMELDGKCVDKHKDIWFAAHKRLKQIYVGDQGDKFDLQKIVNDHPAKDFDVIVDDGGKLPTGTVLTRLCALVHPTF